MWLQKYGVFMWLIFVVVLYSRGECNAITNAQFNASLRDYAVREDNENTTEVKTLQKEYQRYAHFTPMTVPVRFKEIPDSALSPSLSHGRGLLHHNHHGKLGYGDYEEGPHSGYGYEYHFPDEHDGHGHFDGHGHIDGHGHFDGHHRPDHHHHVELHHDHHNHHSYHDDHKYGYGHHHKHFEHALAAKTVLWPIAGIALLGAAAALVSNPVLLQLGVVSGKRRRRDTEEYIDVTPNISNGDFREFHEKYALTRTNNFNHPSKGKVFKITTYKDNDDVVKTTPFTKAIKSHILKSITPKVKKAIQTSADERFKYSKEFEDKYYIPIRLKHKY